jgi:hypothetical protein
MRNEVVQELEEKGFDVQWSFSAASPRIFNEKEIENSCQRLGAASSPNIRSLDLFDQIHA